MAANPKTIDDLTALAGSAIVAGDEIELWDASAGTSKKVDIAELLAALVAKAAATGGAITLMVDPTGSGAGNTLKIKGSDAGSGNTNGGDLVLEPGAKSGSGLSGNVVLRLPGGITGTVVLLVDTLGTNLQIKIFNGALRLSADEGCTLDSGNLNDFRDMIYRNGRSVKTTYMSGVTDKVSVQQSADGVLKIADAAATGPATTSSICLTPAAITGSVNDYAPGTAKFIRIAPDNISYNITGLSAAQDGQEVHLTNIGSAITFGHQNTGSAVANRFLFSTGADILLTTDSTLNLYYDASTQRWRNF